MKGLAAAAVLVALVAFGVWFLGAIVATTTVGAIVLTTLWFGLLGAGVLWLSLRRPAYRRPLGGTFALIAVASLFGLWFTTIRETEVNERLDTGIPASQLPAAERPDVDDLLAPQE